MKLNNVELRKEISFDGYRTLVNTIFDVQTNSGEYRPWEYTIYKPSIILAFCIDGLELEEGESLFNEETIHDLYNMDEISELLVNENFGFIDPPQYYYDAEVDAGKLIDEWLEAHKPINTVLKEFDGILDTLLDLVKGLDPEALKNMIDLASTMPAPEKPTEEKKESIPKKRTTKRTTTKAKE